MKNYDDPQAAEAIKPLMELRNLVNKAIGRANSLEWNVLVIIDDDKHVDHLHVNISNKISEIYFLLIIFRFAFNSRTQV